MCSLGHLAAQHHRSIPSDRLIDIDLLVDLLPELADLFLRRCRSVFTTGGNPDDLGVVALGDLGVVQRPKATMAEDKGIVGTEYWRGPVSRRYSAAS